jgi:hypothetical protein
MPGPWCARSIARAACCSRPAKTGASRAAMRPRSAPCTNASLFPYSESEIAEIAAEIRDPSYRVNVSAAGMHVYNRDGMTNATDPYDPTRDGLAARRCPTCVLPGGGARADADRLASRQASCAGRALKWGWAVRPAVGQDTASPHAYKPEGTTLKAGKRRREVP